jgi:hypothetical protein
VLNRSILCPVLGEIALRGAVASAQDLLVIRPVAFPSLTVAVQVVRGQQQRVLGWGPIFRSL